MQTPAFSMVDSLPMTGVAGEMVFHRPQQRLYRHDGTSWQEASPVPTAPVCTRCNGTGIVKIVTLNPDYTGSNPRDEDCPDCTITVRIDGAHDTEIASHVYQHRDGA